MSSSQRLRSIIVCGFTVVSCGDSPEEPSSIQASALAGMWTGMVGAPMSMTALRMTWAPSEVTSQRVSGPATLVKPMVGVPVIGTLTGDITGSRVALVYTVAAGSVSAAPACPVNGMGSASVSESVMTGTLDLTIGPCAAVGVVPLASNQLSLTKD